MLMFGGYFESQGAIQAFDETWKWDGADWQLLPQQSQPRPSARWYHKLAYDSRRDRAVMFGGYAAGGLVNETWEWDGATWYLRSPLQSPAPRAACCMAYDSVRGQTVVFGGFQGVRSSFVPLGDTWSWDGTNWNQSQATGPSARGLAMMAFDANRGEMLLFGGADPTTAFNDTWSFNGANWQQKATVAAPPARLDAIMGNDPLSGDTILVGGADFGLIETLSDTWVWDGAAWSQFPALLLPERWAGAIALDSDRGELVCFGGRDTISGVGVFYSDTHVLPSSDLRSMSVVVPPIVGMTTEFAFRYPTSSELNYAVSFFALPTTNVDRIWVPGFTTLGLTRIDLGLAVVQQVHQLDSSGIRRLSVGIPNDPGVANIAFEVQTAEVAFGTSTIIWPVNEAAATIQMPLSPVADFNFAPGPGPSTLAVQFTDMSTNQPTSWQWDFDNDGTVDSSQQNPTHTYAAPGIYSVRLIAANVTGSSTVTKTNAVFVGPQASMNMVPIIPGTFAMGSSNGQPGEQPVHQVTISRPFWMGKFEVTQAEYQALVGSDPSSFRGVNLPVNRVTWTEAVSYCAALSVREAVAGRLPAGMVYRLPTEAEWEYCCRAGTSTEWSAGTTLQCSQACFGYYTNVCVTASSQTRSVGSYQPNAFGLHDMHGNVWEWCMDANSPYAGSFGYATPNYPAGGVTNPYVTVGSQRIVRGGDWFLPLDVTRSAFRNVRAEDFVGTGHGFRVVLAPTLP